MKNLNFLILFVLLLVFGISSCDKKADTDSNKQAPQSSTKALTHPEVKALIRAELDKPLPENYEFPDYISVDNDLYEMMDVLWSRYPVFKVTGENLVIAVSQYPDQYVTFLTENKAIRHVYNLSQQQ